MYKAEKTECPYCEGQGEVFDGRRVTAVSIDPPMTTCPVCDGSGEVWKEDAESIDTDMSLADYEREYKEEAALARWEYERENPRDEEDSW